MDTGKEKERVSSFSTKEPGSSLQCILHTARAFMKTLRVACTCIHKNLTFLQINELVFRGKKD